MVLRPRRLNPLENGSLIRTLIRSAFATKKGLNPLENGSLIRTLAYRAVRTGRRVLIPLRTGL